MKLDTETLGVLIAQTIATQNGGNEYVDHLGDGESILITSNWPVVNVVELSEVIIAAITAGKPEQPVTFNLENVNDSLDAIRTGKRLPGTPEATADILGHLRDVYVMVFPNAQGA